MKTLKTKLIILIICLGFMSNAQAQDLSDEKNQSAQELYDFHINKKKLNKTVAWITLGGGVVMIVVGIAINSSLSLFGNTQEGLWLTYVGAATTLVSIPLFIAGAKHKKKAELQLKNGAVGFDNRMDYSGVSLVFTF